MLRFLTAGESHGRGLIALVEGIPSNLNLTAEYIDTQLARRQMGYGRGGRMKIEKDRVDFLSGIRDGRTLGSPVSMLIGNKDWENWKDVMSERKVNPGAQKITIPRPGHADLVGAQKYSLNDIRNAIERSSARETAARVAACSVARKFIGEFGISIGSFVESIGGIMPRENPLKGLLENDLGEFSDGWSISLKADGNSVRVLEGGQEARIVEKIKTAKKKGDTLGGTFVVVATGVPVGLGSYAQYDRKLDAAIASAMMSINAVKGVEIGNGFASASLYGSESHDAIIKAGDSYGRETNRAGGIEGGISTGLPIIVRGAMKPIATLMSPVKSVDLSNGRTVEARRERSDFVAVPACSVIAESMLAWSIAEAFLEKFGGDSVDEIKDNYNNYTRKMLTKLNKNFRAKK